MNTYVITTTGTFVTETVLVAESEEHAMDRFNDGFGEELNTEYLDTSVDSIDSITEVTEELGNG